MAVNLSPIGGVAAQFLDNSGNPLTGGKIFTYAAGTTTPQSTYTSANGATPHANPIILDAAGRVPGGEIWLTDGLQYKFLIKTSTDVQIGSYDNIIGINSNFVNYTNSQEIQTATAGQTVFTLTTMAYQPGTNSLSVFVDGVNQYGPGASYAYQETSSTVVTFTSGLHVGASVKFTTSAINSSAATDAEQVGYVPPFTGSVATNVELKLAQTVSVKDFGAVGDGVTDDTAAIQAAYTAAEALGGAEVCWPAGNYAITGTITCGELSSTNASGGATLTYTGSGTAFVVEGVNTSETHGQFHVMPYINRSSLDWNSGADTTSIGLNLKNRKYNIFVVPGVKRFNTGIALQADVANFVCNTIQLGVIQNNRLGIDFSRITGLWGINQNTIVGGSIVIDGAYTTAVDRIYVNMPLVENNNTTFVGVNLEKGGNEKAVVCASSSNAFVNCRFEGAATTAGYITVSGNNNRFSGGAPSSSATIPFVTWITDTGSGNTWQMANVIANKYLVWDTHSASRALRFGNGTAYPATPIGAFGTDRLSLGDSSVPAIRYWGMMQQESPAITSGTTLPQRSALVLTYGAATTVTQMIGVGFTDTSSIVSITSTNANATLQHVAVPAANAGRFVLKGGVNLTLTAYTPVIFQLVGGNLYQI